MSQSSTITPSALVLSGGGALGIAQLGAIQTLIEAGNKFEFFSGTSAGAIIVAGLAYGYSVEDMKRILKNTKFFSFAFDFKHAKYGLVKGDAIMKVLDDIFGETRIEDLDFPLFITATNFSTGDRTNIHSGRIKDAVRASISVPILLEPFYHTEFKQWFVDGGLIQNFPLDTAIEKYKGEKIWGINVRRFVKEREDFSKKSHFFKTPRLFDVAQQCFDILFQNQQVQFLKDSRVDIVRLNLSKFTFFDILKSEELQEVGRSEVEKYLAAKEDHS